MITYFLDKSEIVDTYESLIQNPDFPDRLMHHDTKINNVLLDRDTQRGLAVCDLDTLMPGKIISDLGDMVRTYVSPVSEESIEFDKGYRAGRLLQSAGRRLSLRDERGVDRNGEIRNILLRPVFGVHAGHSFSG